MIIDLASDNGQDHPRIRGEHAVELVDIDAVRGIIPAYAGSTGERPHVRGLPLDHPRIRGEHGRISFDIEAS